jgi:hypothetical protein
MSWWIGTEIDAGGTEAAQLSDRNVTYNVAPMFQLALAIPKPGIHGGGYCRCRYPDGDGSHETGLRALHQAPCSEAAGVISAALGRMRADPQAYRAMNPANGWGSYESAMADLEWLLERCAEHPGARVYVH